MSPLDWQEFQGRYHVGDVVEGRVSKVVPFGAFVQIDGFDGLFVGLESVEVGSVVTGRIAGIDPEKTRFSLTAA
jgi:ribosomal protein S1